ncbi:hypothetical protein TNCT_320131 [Trichonephila clavata]|uniref:Uncharacterized protein n=1 Tax=Trichonephila clavata TaxID=2740835 RepID=A0A8X6L8I6_TRICU|nr:hypothetical protein TNCT_320131 [Trichonephila clavata]
MHVDQVFPDLLLKLFKQDLTFKPFMLPYFLRVYIITDSMLDYGDLQQLQESIFCLIIVQNICNSHGYPSKVDDDNWLYGSTKTANANSNILVNA